MTQEYVMPSLLSYWQGLQSEKLRLVPNPLLKFPRNKECICGSRKKFKLCHLNQLPRMVPKEMADNANTLLGKLKAKGVI